MVEFVLTIENGPEAGKQVRLEVGTSYPLGRGHEARIRLPGDDHLVSRLHAILDVTEGGIELRDMQSRNGTFVDGAKVKAARVGHGSRLRIGRTEMVLTLIEEDSESQTDTVPIPRVDVRDPLGFDDLDLELQTREGGPVAFRDALPTVEDSAPCDGCARFGTAPRGAFRKAGRLCADCAAARRGGEGRPESAGRLVRVGPYQVVRLVGRGAAGAVYEARHLESEAHVALKTLLPDAPDDKSAIRRFLREQRVAITLDHPRVVRCFDVGEDAAAALLYIATEWLPGGDAETLCSPQLSLEVALSLGADLFEALGYLHGRGFIHRDVKPANLLLVHDGAREIAGKLSDFGIVRSTTETSRLTMDSEMGGTPLYVAPEQLLDFKWVGKSTDIYGAAASLYALLTGATPLPLERVGGGVVSVAVYTAALDDARVPLLSRRSDVPRDLAHLVDAAVARDPTAREGLDAGQMASYLRQLAKSEW